MIGANEKRKGYFEVADKGTIFLDNEDGASSWIGQQVWTGSSLGPESYPSSVPGIVSVDGNQNTTMYFSKVNL